MTAISIKDLQKTYPKGTVALKGVSLDIPKGSFFGLLGPNGAGKTTLIHSVCGLVEPSGGSIQVLGRNAHKEYRYARTHLGLSQQEVVLDPFVKLEDLLVFQGRYFGIPKQEAKDRAEALMKRFGIWEKRKSTTREISGGQKRRVELAKALMHNPEVLILDEPTAGLDVETRKDLWKAVSELNKKGLTVLLTTHYIEEAQQLCDTVAIIHDGNIIEVAEKSALLNKYAQKTITATYEHPPKAIKGARKTSNTLTVEIVGGDDEAKVLARLQGAGNLTSIDTKRQSLEEVFLQLTGRDRK
jgi:ABC-2 type transport system ATP-binding protein